jgi:hypothetical protein
VEVRLFETEVRNLISTLAGTSSRGSWKRASAVIGTTARIFVAFGLFGHQLYAKSNEF